MEIYFFVVITLIIIGLLAFALSESKGKNSPNARSKFDGVKYQAESETPAASLPNTLELAPAQSNQ
ncbi:MAG: hypothetical protein ACJAWT_000796 [Glaciecola sp.]|jgi:hypothetical protein